MTVSIHFGIERSILVLVVLAVTVNCQDVLKCMSCRKAAHFTHCEDMVKCDPEREVCYVEEEIDIGGEIVVNAGCREKAQCNAIGCFGDDAKRRKRSSGARDGDIKTNIGDTNRDIICHHCCDGDFCNMYGCPDSFDVSHLPGSRCFVCEHVLQPEHCNTIKNCEAGYSCGVEKVSFGVGERYTLQCIKSQKCAMLRMIHNNNTGKRRKRNYISLWAECCDSHLCNGYLPMKEEPPPIASRTYKCPDRVNGANPISSGTNSSSSSTSTTSAVATTERGTTTTDSVCKDIDTDCYAYGVDKNYLCHGTFAGWARQHCAKYCGFCGSQTTTDSVCEDLDTDCSLYGVEYLCHGTYADWARQHCSKYCGFCGTTRMDSLPAVTTIDTATTAASSALCEDLDDDCDEYGIEYICMGQYADWAKGHCAKYCGFCGTSRMPRYERSKRRSTSGQGRSNIPSFLSVLFVLISCNIF